MKRTGIIRGLIIIVVFFMVGCSQSPDGENTLNEAPASSVSGYYDVDQSYRGGVGSKGVNIKRVAVEPTEQGSQIVIHFVSGSETMSGGETILETPPEYVLRVLPKPYRLELQLKGISYWDYSVVNGTGSNGLVMGSVRQIPVNTEITVLYFQLGDRPVYKVSESEGTLTIDLIGTKEKAEKAYYISANAFFDYQEGRVPSDIGLFPSLCSDMENVTLLSAPYPTLDAAEAEMREIQSWFDSNLPGKSARIVELTGSEMPVYDETADQAELETRPIARRNGLGYNYPVAVPDGRVLDVSANGRLLVTRPMEPLANGTISEELWVQGEEGRFQKVLDIEFMTITDAAFSPDGSRVAFIEQTSQWRFLYVVDVESGRLTTVSENGVGNDVSSFAWGRDGNTLYCMSMTDMWQLMRVDLSGEEMSVSNATNQEGASGRIAVLHDTIYFMGYDANGADVIYAVDGAGQVTTFAAAADFAISPDGSWMVLSMVSADEQVILYELHLRDMRTGEVRRIVEPRQIRSLLWGSDSNILYYDVSRWEEETMFPHELHVYNIAQDRDVVAMELIDYGALLATELEGVLLLETNYFKNDQIVPVVYRLNLE